MKDFAFICMIFSLRTEARGKILACNARCAKEGKEHRQPLPFPYAPVQVWGRMAPHVLGDLRSEGVAHSVK